MRVSLMFRQRFYLLIFFSLNAVLVFGASDIATKGRTEINWIDILVSFFSIHKSNQEDKKEKEEKEKSDKAVGQILLILRKASQKLVHVSKKSPTRTKI